MNILYILFIYSKTKENPVQLSIDNRSDQPIYEQIAAQIKAQIISGALTEDTLLPSIRSLAKDLRISVITTKRAYEELERQGFIYTVKGRGNFVKGDALLKDNKKRELVDKIVELFMEAHEIGLSIDELVADIKEHLARIESGEKKYD